MVKDLFRWEDTVLLGAHISVMLSSFGTAQQSKKHFKEHDLHSIDHDSHKNKTIKVDLSVPIDERSRLPFHP